jgi:hypothetical protein
MKGIVKVLAGQRAGGWCKPARRNFESAPECGNPDDYVIIFKRIYLFISTRVATREKTSRP